MIVQLNGEPVELSDEATVLTVVESLEPPAQARGIAVAVDAEVVPRSAWDRRRLHDGAQVEVVAAVQGG